MVLWSVIAGLCVTLVVARSPEEHKYTDPVPYPEPPSRRGPNAASFTPDEYPEPPQYHTEPPRYSTTPPPYHEPNHKPYHPTPPPYYEPNPKHPHPSPPPYYEPTHNPGHPTPPPYYEPTHNPSHPTPPPYYEPNPKHSHPTPPPYYEPEYPTEPPLYREEPFYPTVRPMYPTEPPMYPTEAPVYYDEPQYPTAAPVYYDEPKYQPWPLKSKYDEKYHDERPYDENQRPVSPSKSMATGYVPEEILMFRKNYVDLVKRFKGTPLLTSQELFAESSIFYPQEEYGPNEHRGGRAFNWQGMLTSLGIAPTTFGFGAGAWPFNMLGNSVGLTEQDQVNVGGSVQLFDTGRALAGPKKAKPQMKNVEPCGNGDGTCEGTQQCFIDGGESIGKCLNCLKCSACCKYAYEDQSMSNKTISFFQSPGYPDTRRDAYSSSYTLEIRYDVSQVLIEFIDFEMPISPRGCTDLDYLEIISPLDPNGVLGPGNSRFCGLNTDQHLYLRVRGGDLMIFKAVTSGVGFVPLALGPDGLGHYDYDGNYVSEGPQQYDEYGKPYGHGDGKYQPKKPKSKPPVYPAGDSAYRFKIKITQIIDAAPYRYLSQKGSGKVGSGGSGGNFKIGEDFAKGYVQYQSDIPDFYRRLSAPSGCKQYFMEQSGTVESFNFDGNSMMPNNLDYSVCFRVPEKSCGISISALKFDIPAWNPDCMSGERATSGGFPCCTAGLTAEQGEYGAVDTYGKYGRDVRVEKFLGVDGTSDGYSKGIDYKTNLLRYFFCGENMGKTNFVVSERKGPFRLQVYSDGNWAKNYYGQGHGFRIKYEVDTGC